MAIRLSGLTSGMDTDAIVQELVSAYSKKTEKYEKQATKLTWRQDAWKNLNTKIYGLYTNVSNMRFSSAYNLRKTSVSDATKATVTANSDAVTGTQTLNILKTAQASYMTGGKLGSNITEDSKMSDLGYKEGNTEITIRTASGEEKEISIKKDSTIKDVLNQMKEAGYNASFDATNKRIFVSAKKSGAANDFDIIAESAEAKKALSALGLNAALVEVDEKGNKTLTGAAGQYADVYNNYYLKALNDESGAYIKDDGSVDVEKYINDQITAYNDLKADAKAQQYVINDERIKVNQLNEQIKKLEAHQTARSAHATLLDKLDDYGLSSYNLKKMVPELEADADGNYTEDAVRTAMEAAGMTADDFNVADITTTLNENKDAIKDVQNYTDKYSDFLSMKPTEIAAAIETANEELATARENVETYESELAAIKENIDKHPLKELVESNTVEKDDAKTAENIAAAVKGIMKEVDEAVAILNDPESTKGSAIKIVGSDAEIQLNGVTYTSDTNSFVVNGLSINTLAKTDGEITITTNVDTQGIYDKVKDFLTEYNNVVNEMTKLYNADSAGDYEPLTDEEKEAMSDEQIEKWENKIKDSLLRRDTTLNSILSVMVNSMSQTIEIDGETVSLSTFGIQTLGFLNAPKNEHYAYHIDGDADDENSSGKKDKLMAAIEQDPEKVEEFMKKLSENLYKSIDNKMKSTELSSAYKVYNDKEMDREAKKYAEAIAKWEEKVKDKEDYYFKQFSNMEVALSKLQSQTSSISGLLGM